MLTPQQKHSLVEALLTDMNRLEDVPSVVGEMADCAWHDVALIEPIIVDMLEQADARGRLQGILETLNPATCAPAPAKVPCAECGQPAQFITYRKAHCFEHRPVVA